MAIERVRDELEDLLQRFGAKASCAPATLLIELFYYEVDEEHSEKKNKIVTGHRLRSSSHEITVPASLPLFTSCVTSRPVI